MILKCKDIEVYNIKTQEVLNFELCPGLVAKGCFLDWLHNRFASATNSFFQAMRNKYHSNKSVYDISIATNSVSLSDCYWIDSTEDPRLKWSSISPYTNFNETTVYRLPGYKNKKWLNSTDLYKEDSIEDYYAYQYCKLLGIQSQEVVLIPNTKHVIIKNMTNEDLFLEQADYTGLLNRNTVTDGSILNLYGYEFGYLDEVVDMLFIDILLYNTDRHLGNFGLLKSTNPNNCGSKFAPLYDFDNCFDLHEDKGSYEAGIKEFLTLLPATHYTRILNYIDKLELSDLYKANIIKERAKNIKEGILKSI